MDAAAQIEARVAAVCDELGLRLCDCRSIGSVATCTACSLQRAMALCIQIRIDEVVERRGAKTSRERPQRDAADAL